MKQIMYASLAILLTMAACKEHNHDHKGDQHTAPAEAVLQLDQGKKWQADAAARIAYALLDKEATTAKLTNRAQVDKFVDRQEKIITQLLKECTMKGAAHENLHVLIGQTNTALKTLKDATPEHFEHRLAELRSNTALFKKFFD